MADLKSIANMQIGGPKYPKKRRINLYQKQTKKGKIAAELGAFAVFMVFVYGFSRFGVMLPLQEAEPGRGGLCGDREGASYIGEIQRGVR